MDFINIHHNDENREVFMAKMDDAEFVNPIEKFKNDIIDFYKATQLGSLSFARKNNLPSPLNLISSENIEAFLEFKGYLLWKEQFKRIMDTPLSDEIFKTLNCQDKDSQIKIFKAPFKLTTLSLQKFFFKAWQLYGYKFSDYRIEHDQKGLDIAHLPQAFFIDENNNIKTFGKTKLKEGELKNAIRHRKVTIAKFLDNESEWHCFYYNYNSINGKEAGGASHIHYISSNWTISRHTVLNELRKRHHSFTSSVHIDYIRG